MKKKKMKSVVQGALLLTIAGLLSKVMSALYRVPLQNLTGDFGFYIYQQVYPFISMAIILGLYGFPIAVSKLTTEQIEKRAQMTWRHFYGPLFLILLSMNGFIACLIFFLAPFLAKFAGDMQLIGIYQMTALMFFVLPMIALLRGLFQGQAEMQQTAYSQIIEQIFRVAIIITGAYFVATGKWNLYAIGKTGVLGTVIGMGVAVLFLTYLWRKRHTTIVVPQSQGVVEIPWRYYLYTCITFGIAASLNQLILIFIQFVDVFTMVPGLVSAGMDPYTAMEQKGVFDRGQPLIQFGVVFGSSFALALFPSVIKANMNQDKAALFTIREAVLFGFYLAVGATIGLILIMPEANILLYQDAVGTGALRILVISIIFTSMLITVNAILQSLHVMRRVALYIVGAVLLKWLLNKLLIPYLGIVGSALATVISLCCLTLILLSVLQLRLKALQLFRHVHWQGLFMASGSMILTILMMKWLLADVTSLSRIMMLGYVCLLVIVGALIFMLMLLRYHVFTKQQLAALPFSSGWHVMYKIVAKKRNKEIMEEQHDKHN